MTQDEPQAAKQEAQPTGRLRGVERLIWVAFAALLLVLAGGAYWHLTLERILFLGIGVACLLEAWLVWRYRIVGYSYSEGFDPDTGEDRPPTTTVTKAPVSRQLLTPLLLAAAVGFLLAGTRTRVGAVLHGPAHAAVESWNFAEGTWNLLTSAGLVVGTVIALAYGVGRRERDALAAGGCLGGLLAFAIAANYGYYLIDSEAWRRGWNDFLAPARTVIEQFS